MKSLIMLTCCFVCVASTLFGEILADFEMNDASGTLLKKIRNDADGGNQFNYSTNNIQTDGNGVLVYTLGETNSNYAHANLTTTNNTGRFKLSLSFDSATVSGNAGAVGYAIQDENLSTNLVYIKLIKNNDRFRLVMQDWNHVDDITGVGTNTLPDRLNITITYDLTTDLADFSWVMGTQSGGYTNVAIVDGSASSLRNVFQPSGMSSSDYFKTDYIKVETIPEPVTASIIAFIGLCSIFIRRRFNR